MINIILLSLPNQHISPIMYFDLFTIILQLASTSASVFASESASVPPCTNDNPIFVAYWSGNRDTAQQMDLVNNGLNLLQSFVYGVTFKPGDLIEAKFIDKNTQRSDSRKIDTTQYAIFSNSNITIYIIGINNEKNLVKTSVLDQREQFIPALCDIQKITENGSIYIYRTEH